MNTAIELRATLSSSAWTKTPFSTLALLARNVEGDPNLGRELTIRALNSREHLTPEYRTILDEITARTGLHPYVKDHLTSLSTRTALAHAAHEVGGEMSGFTIHTAQAKVLSYLEDGESVVLSAPTSFGKSLLIDLVISSRQFDNVVLIVPTLALVEETRRRMSRFSDRYSVITTVGQTSSKKNIYVLTQERYLSLKDDIAEIDFFAIDEFYKLSISDDGARSTQLNEALIHLLRNSRQFFMLGPSIGSIPDTVKERLNCRVVVEKFQTVVTELIPLSAKPSKVEALATLLDNPAGPTLIYCRSPGSSRKLLKDYLEIRNVPKTRNKELLEAADWTSTNFHSEWLVSVALIHGIGIHHGRLPRALARFMVRAFERGIINTLLCTSTLIEGVNTTAKSVVVFDNKIGGNTKKHSLDFFTFNNIRGRAGRMFEHFIGNVYYFEDPPQEELPFVDIPAVNPSEDTPSSLLIRMNPDFIPESLTQKHQRIIHNGFLSFETIQSISGIEPEFMIESAKYLTELPVGSLNEFSWSNRPTYADIQVTSNIIWHQLGGSAPAKLSGMRSANMMTYWIWQLYVSRSASIFRREMIQNQIDREGKPDEAVETVLSFLRNWASFNYPKYLSALNEITNEILRKRGLRPANYLPFAVQIEHLFQPSSFSALEEYGLPSELAQSLVNHQVFAKEDSLDDVIKSLRRTDLARFAESRFERGMLDDFQTGIMGHRAGPVD